MQAMMMMRNVIKDNDDDDGDDGPHDRNIIKDNDDDRIMMVMMVPMIGISLRIIMMIG